MITLKFISILSFFLPLLNGELNLGSLSNHKDSKLLKQFHQTWNLSTHLTYLEDLLVPTSGKNTDAYKFGQTCNVPGYTGQFCENPICEEVNVPGPNPSPGLMAATIDFAFDSSCSNAMSLYIDSTMKSFQIELSTLTASKSSILLFNSSGISFLPDSIETDDEPLSVVYFYNPLPPGEYKLIPSTDLSTACYIYVNSYVTGDIKIGFVPHDDYSLAPERNDFPIDNLFQNQLNTIVAQRINIKSPGSIAGITLFQGTNMMPRPRKMSIRYGCTNEYYYSSIRCNDLATYFIRVDGFDFFGNQFRRVKTFSCEVDTETTKSHDIQTTQSPFVPLICLNNGTLVTDPKTNSQTCFCQGAFYGATCGTSYCFNDGINLSNGECLCKPSFSGPNCESVSCLPDSGITTNEDYYTPVFVIRLRVQLSSVVSDLAVVIADLAQLYSDDRKWFQQFGLVVFNNYGATFNTTFFDNTEDLVVALEKYASTMDDTGDCSDSTFEAVSTALSTFILGNKSPLYVISDVIADISDTSIVDVVSELDSIYLSPIYFIQLQSKIDGDGCNAYDESTPAFKALKTVSRRSGGDVYVIQENEYDDVGPFIQSHFTYTYFMSELLYLNDQEVCSDQPNRTIITVDKDFFQLTIVGTGSNLAVELLSPLGTRKFASLVTNLANAYVWTVTGLEIGNWEVNIIGSVEFMSECSIRMYSNLDPDSFAFTEHYRVSYGFTFATQLDLINRQPVVGKPNSFVAKVSNIDNSIDGTIRSELYIYEYIDDKRTLSFAANGDWRDNCDYNFIFPAYTCHTPNQILYFSFFIITDSNVNVQRAGSMYCSYIAPPKQNTCQNGGALNNGTCICSNYFKGDHCQEIICQNGGTSYKSFCECPPAVVGEYCQTMSCTIKNEQPPQFRDSRTLVFVLDMSYWNFELLGGLDSQIVDLITSILYPSSTYIDTVKVIGYDDIQTILLGEANRTSLQPARDAFDNAEEIASTNRQVCLHTRQWQALRMAEQLSKDGSIVVLFTSAIPDQTDLDFAARVGESYVERKLSLHAWVSAYGNNAYVCNEVSPVFSLTRTIAEQTYNGAYFEISGDSYDYVFTVISGFIDNNILYKKTIKECNGTCSVWFPVDSHVQNVFIRVNGHQEGVSYSIVQPNGQILNDNFELLSDPNVGLAIIELRQSCPEYYKPFGKQHCYTFNSEPDAYNDALKACQSDNAHLLDITSAEREALVDEIMADAFVDTIWLGLNSIEGILFGWSWNEGNNPSISWTSSMYSNFANGTDMNDENKVCSMKQGKWSTVSCYLGMGYICIKSAYDDAFKASANEDAMLPRGKWSLSIQEYDQIDVEIRVHSNIRLTTGFTTNVHSDFPVTEAIGDSSLNRALTHVTQLNEGWVTANLEGTMIYSAVDNSLIAAATYQKRQSCSYQFMSQTIFCNPDNYLQQQFYMIHSGVDEFGYSFQRFEYGTCARQVTSCGNGVLKDGVCYCPELWSGPQCNIPLCQNGAILDPLKNKCNCKIGYSGYACQLPNCLIPSTTQFTTSNKTFVLIVENTLANLDALTSLQFNMEAILGSEDSSYYTELIFVTYDSLGQPPQIKIATSIFDFMDGLMNLVTTDRTTSCNLGMFEAMIIGLQSLYTPQSTVYVAARGNPNDLLNEGDFFALLLETQPQLFIHYSSIAGVCKFDPDDHVTKRMSEYAVASNGYLIPTSSLQFTTAISLVIPALYKGSVLANPIKFGNVCAATMTRYISIDESVRALTIFIYANNPNLVITDANGNNLKIINEFTDPPIKGNLSLHIFQVIDLTSYGIYIFNAQDIGICSMQIRTTVGSALYTGYVPYVLASPTVSSHLDNATAVPLSDINVIVGSIIGDAARLTYVEVYNTLSLQFQYLKFHQRTECSYHYYSDPFKCSTGQFVLKFFGIDKRGSILEREGFTSCIKMDNPQTTQTTTQIIETTSTTQVTTFSTTLLSDSSTTTHFVTPSVATTTSTVSTDRANLYIILDTSSAVPADKYSHQLSQFFVTALARYQINSKFVNVAVGVSGGANNVEDDYPVFNGFTSINQLQNAINSDYYPQDGPQSAGQSNLAFLLGLALNKNFLDSGYDASAKPHILLYLTTNSYVEGGAVDNAEAIMESGIFKIIVVAYNPNADLQNYFDMANCIFNPANQDDLTSVATTIGDLISDANNNNAEIIC